MQRPFRFLISTLATFTALIAWLEFENATELLHLGMLEKEEVQMPNAPKTVCVGRLLIDLPDTIKWQLSGAAIDSFDIAVERETEDAFGRRLAARIDELTHPVQLEGSKARPLELARRFVVGKFQGTLLVAERETSYYLEGEKKIWDTSVRIEAYARSDGFSVDISGKFRDPNEIERPLQLLSKIVLNPEDAIPSEPGFCVGNAYFREPLLAEQNERITLRAGMKDHPDLTLVLDSTVGAQSPAEDLLERHAKWKESISVLDRMNVTDISLGKRSISSFPGLESLTRFREHNHTTGFAFSWESRAVAGNVLRPALYLEMQTGVNPRSGGAPTDSTLSQREAVDLWQAISSSIRLRPASPPAPTPVASEIGSRGTAGSPCPRSGWWECSEDGGTLPIAGGRRRHFKAGDTFPQADVMAPQTLWEKVKGRQTTFQSKYPTVWRLVEPDTEEGP